MTDLVGGTLMSIRGGVYTVHSKSGMVEASLRGKLKQQGRSQVVVGDIVRLQQQDDGAHTIEGREDRRNVLRRRTPGRSKGVRIVAANLDEILVVGSVREPDWNWHLIDRFLAVAEANDIPPVLVINKADLDDRVDELAALYRRIGYHVIVTSTRDRRGIDELRRLVAGRVSLFTGSSGVGKSSLVKAVEPGLCIRIGAVSEKAGTGRHTTVAAEMFPLAGGGFVVDTPGLRDVGLWALSPAEVVAAFPELAEFAAGCRFDDCRHVDEPGCEVVRACERGRVAESRMASYRTFLEEAERSARHWE